MKNILITFDLNGHEQPLIDKTVEIAECFGSKIWLMHVAAPDPDFVGYGVGPQYIRDSRAAELRREHKMLLEFSKTLTEKGLDSEGLLIQGATIEMILEESKKLHIDLIIAGHHKHGFFYNAFVGSVSTHIIRDSHIPVMIVPIKD